MKTLLFFTLFVIVLALPLQAMGVAVVYELEPGALSGPDAVLAPIEITREPQAGALPFAFGFTSAGDGSTTYLELPYTFAHGTRDGQYEGRFDVATLLLSGGTVRNLNRFLANNLILESP